MSRNKLTPRTFNQSSTSSSGELSALACKECGRIVENCGSNIKAVTCSYCVAKAVAPPELPKSLQTKTEESRPRGWQFRKNYVSPSGKVYSFGREVDEQVKSTVGTISKSNELDTTHKSPDTGSKHRKRKKK